MKKSLPLYSHLDIRMRRMYMLEKVTTGLLIIMSVIMGIYTVIMSRRKIVVSVQVHLYLPLQEEFIELKNRVRRAIYAQGFTLPQITFQMTEDKVYRHMIFTCNIEEEE